MYDYKKGWWWGGGEFTLEHFVGLWIIPESSDEPIRASFVIETIAQGLYVGHDSTKEDAACPASVCINLMAAKSQLTGGFLSTKDVSTYLGYGYTITPNTTQANLIMNKAFGYGDAALHPSSLNPDENNAPQNWGNSPNGTHLLRTKYHISDGYHGSEIHSIYFMQQTWLVYTPNQAAHWPCQNPAVNVTDLSPLSSDYHYYPPEGYCK
jgi:hypothetical protein